MNQKESASEKSKAWRNWAFSICFLVGVMGAKVAEDLEYGQASPPSARTQLHGTMHDVPGDQEDAARAFYDIVTTHPQQEIREDLSRLIKKKEVLLNYGDPSSDAQESAAAVTYIHLPERGDVLMLVASKEKLLVNPSVSRVRKQLVIYHEWIHVKQQRERRYPKWLVQVRDADVPVPEEELRLIFESEAEAYLAECQLADSLGVEDELPMCQGFASAGVRGLRITLAEHYASQPFYAPYAATLMRFANDQE